MERTGELARLVFACLAFLSLLHPSVANPNTTTFCAEISTGEVSWGQCEVALKSVVGGDTKSVIEGTSHVVWTPVQAEQDLIDYCTMFNNAHDTAYLTRSEISPVSEQYLAAGLHDMLDYILCGGGVTEYLEASDCLRHSSLHTRIRDCFMPYSNFSKRWGFDQIRDQDSRVHEHCETFKTYQQCRVDVFTELCGDDAASFNDKAIIKYYKKYMDNLYCDIDSGITTKEIIFIVFGVICGMILLLCMCFCCSRFHSCNNDSSQENIRAYFKKMAKLTNDQKQKQKPAIQQNGKDAEKGKDKTPVKNDYYNTKEIDNNANNEKLEQRKRGVLETLDERDEMSHRGYPGGKSRGGTPGDSPRDFSRRLGRDFPRDSPRDSPRGFPRNFPRNSPRDSPMDSPRGLPRGFPGASPMGYPRGYAGQPPSYGLTSGQMSRSYDDMFRSQFNQRGFPQAGFPLRGGHDARSAGDLTRLQRY